MRVKEILLDKYKKMNENEHLLFQPINDPEDSKGALVQHFEKHYKKHLFGLGILSGIAMFKILTVLGSYLGITNITETTNAEYKPSIVETALQTFDQIEKIAKQRDEFFHQEGRIYSYTGETLFQQLDTQFHIFDNAYRSASEITKKLQRAKQLGTIINQQSELFQATQDINSERETLLQELSETFNALQEKIQEK